MPQPSIHFTGLSLKLARAVPMSAINFLAYEQRSGSGSGSG